MRACNNCGEQTVPTDVVKSLRVYELAPYCSKCLALVLGYLTLAYSRIGAGEAFRELIASKSKQADRDVAAYRNKQEQREEIG